MPITPKQQPPYYEGTNSIKYYKAAITQTGTANPTVTIYQNTIGNIVWTRQAEGNYIGTLTAAFPTGKVLALPFGKIENQIIMLPVSGNSIGYYTIVSASANEISLQTFSDLSYTQVEMSTITGTSQFTMLIDLIIYP